MEQVQINYADVIALGFKRKDLEDNIFFKQHGYQWFIVEYKLPKMMILEWDCETRLVTLSRYDKEYCLIAKMPVYNIDHLRLLLKFFKKR